MGGPFYIPKVYNTSKNKTFFFFSEERALYRAATTVGGSAPTALMRTGDFSECDPKSGNYLGSQYPQYFSSAYCIAADSQRRAGGTRSRRSTITPQLAERLCSTAQTMVRSGCIGTHKVPTNFSDTVRSG